MKSLKYVLIPAIFAIVSQYAIAQFTLSGEFRPRTEFNHGYKSLATDNQKYSTFTTQRSRLNFMFNSPSVKTKLVLQDVRLWGNQPQLVANEDYAVSVHEAWAEVALASDFWLKAGRQELVYDDHRIFGNVGWAQQTRSHDVALFKLEKDFKLHFGIAHHESGNITNNLYNGPDSYKNLQFSWFNKSWGKNSLSLLFVNNGVQVMTNQKQVTNYSQILGGHLSKGFEKGTLATNIYFQTGKHTSGKEISALNLLIEASLKNGFALGYEYLSGNSYDKSDKVYAFTPFYGTNHKFNGYMDYFYVSNHINSVGLQDAYVKYNYSKNRFGINADLHYFASAGKISANADKYLGTELDLTLIYKIHESASFSAGWSTMFAGESMELLKGGNRNSGNNWAYLMITVTPTFLK